MESQTTWMPIFCYQTPGNIPRSVSPCLWRLGLSHSFESPRTRTRHTLPVVYPEPPPNHPTHGIWFAGVIGYDITWHDSQKCSGNNRGLECKTLNTEQPPSWPRVCRCEWRSVMLLFKYLETCIPPRCFFLAFHSHRFGQWAIKVIKLIRFIGTRHVPVFYATCSVLSILGAKFSRPGIRSGMLEVGVSPENPTGVARRTAGHSLIHTPD